MSIIICGCFGVQSSLFVLVYAHMTKLGRPMKDDAKRASITIRMSDEIHKKLKEYASEHGLSMTEVALKSLEEFLSKMK